MLIEQTEKPEPRRCERSERPQAEIVGEARIMGCTATYQSTNDGCRVWCDVVGCEMGEGLVLEGFPATELKL